MQTVSNMSIKQIIKNAWQRVDGFKAIFWKAFVIFLILLILQVLFFNIFPKMLFNIYFINMPFAQLIKAFFITIKIITQLLILPLGLGIHYITIRYRKNLTVKTNDVFYAYHFFWQAIKFMIIFDLIICLPIIVFIMIGIILGNLDGVLISILSTLFIMAGIIWLIYGFCKFSLSYLAFVDRRLPIMQVLKLSFNASRHHFWLIFGIFITFILASTLTCIPLIILMNFDLVLSIIGVILSLLAYIWVLPFIILLFVELYENLIGIQTEA